LQIDPSGALFLLGRTEGNYPISPGVYAMPNTDVFIDRISADLDTSVLSTRLGMEQSASRFFPTSFLLDMCGNVYLAGMPPTFNAPTLPLTPDAFSTTPDDFWFIVLKPHFSDILFGSYYGSPDNDHSHVGVTRMDPNGVVYQSVCSASQNFPTTPGVVGPTKMNSSGQDIVSFKFDFQATGVKAGIALNVSQNDSICAPGTVALKNTSTSPYPITYLWDFGDGNTSTAVDPVHTYDSAGTYDVVLHAHSDSACITDSWDTFRITVLYVELPDIVTEDVLVCSDEDAINLSVLINNPSENNIIQWGPS